MVKAAHQSICFKFCFTKWGAILKKTSLLQAKWFLKRHLPFDRSRIRASDNSIENRVTNSSFSFTIRKYALTYFT